MEQTHSLFQQGFPIINKHSKVSVEQMKKWVTTWKLFSGSLLLNAVKLCGLALNALHKLWHTPLWYRLAFIHSTAPPQWKAHCFKRTFCSPISLSLHVLTYALLSASNLLTHFCCPSLTHLYSPPQMPPLHDPTLGSPAVRVLPHPPWGHSTSHRLFLCYFSFPGLRLFCWS